jgi:3'(2'), 5'-bisphosphate nucleotidase
MENNDLHLMKAVCHLAREAGVRILDIYETEFDVQQKHDKSPVTEADMAAHDYLAEELANLQPGYPIISEEDTVPPFAQRRQWQRYWLVDPLDGTREFVKRNGEFTVNVALIDNGEPIVGVIHAPLLNTSYFACRGKGAWRQEGEMPLVTMQVRQECASPVVVAGGLPNKGSRLDTFLQRLGPHTHIRVGSSLKSCLVADGRVDIYARFGPTSEWDTAAAQCIVEEAGGRMTDMFLKPLRYNQKDSILNPHFLVFGDVNKDWGQYLEGLR